MKTLRYITLRCIYLYIPFNNDIIRGKALKSVRFVVNDFSQIANIEPKLTTYWHKTGEQTDLEMSSVSTISHEERRSFHSAFPRIKSLLKGLYIV